MGINVVLVSFAVFIKNVPKSVELVLFGFILKTSDDSRNSATAKKIQVSQKL